MIITRQGDYNNYDKSKFSASKSAISIDGKTAEKTKEVMSTIKAELDKAPSLEPYEYKPWDDEARDFVNSILRNYLNPGDSMDSVASKPAAKRPAAKTKVTETKVAESANVGNDADFEFPEDMQLKTDASSADDLDSFLNDLDL